MKKLQESLLDDDDKLFVDTRNAAINNKALKILETLNDYIARDKGDDWFGRKLKRGDIVITGSRIGESGFCMVHSVDETDDKCILVWDRKNFKTDYPKQYVSYDCEYLIKIDLKTFEQIVR